MAAGGAVSLDMNRNDQHGDAAINVRVLPARLSFWDGFRVVSGHHAS